MRILSFKKQFKEKLNTGRKTSTLRKHKKPHKQGDMVQIYCPSPRSGKGEKLFNAKITLTQNVKYCPKDGILFLGSDKLGLDIGNKHVLAITEGFENFKEMNDWFLKEYPKENYLHLTRYMFFPEESK